VLKLAVFDRHKASGRFSVGFASGFGIHGALAQTVSHDAHNLLVLGDNDEDMAIAANALMKCGGGEVAVVDGEIKAQVALPVCGLMSDERVDQVAAEVAKVEGVWREMGCTMPSPFMTLGLISLAVIPEIRLTNRGLVDCNAFKFIPVIVPDDEK
jgi:adenine deaminase